MGTWGTAIFADDTAEDVRDAWREAILDGLSAEEATARVIQELADPVQGDPYEEGVFWLALAAAQMETGRLQPEARARALAVIEAGTDVARWAEEDAVRARQREKVLERLAAKLRAPQPSPKRLRPPRNYSVSFDLGDVVRVRNAAAGAEALFAVVATTGSRPSGNLARSRAALLGRRRSTVSGRTRGDAGACRGGVSPEEMARRARSAAAPHEARVDCDDQEVRSIRTAHRRRRRARGIERDPNGHYESEPDEGVVWVLGATWPRLVEWITEPEYRRAIELTRLALAHGYKPGR